jgi:hypothetical protein
VWMLSSPRVREAGGHAGTISTTVLVPQVVDIGGPRVAVLAAGAISHGRLIAAALALGVWHDLAWYAGRRTYAAWQAPAPAAAKHAVLSVQGTNSARKTRGYAIASCRPVVGTMKRETSVREVVIDLLSDYAEAAERLKRYFPKHDTDALTCYFRSNPSYPCRAIFSMVSL